MGRTSDYQSSYCYDCPLGRAGGGGSGTCHACSIGMYADTAATVNCDLCASGRSECHTGAWNCSITCDSLGTPRGCDPGINPQLACDTAEATANAVHALTGILIGLCVAVIALIGMIVKCCCCKKKQTGVAGADPSVAAPPTPVDFTATNPVAVQPEMMSPVASAPPTQMQPTADATTSQPKVETLADFLQLANLVEYSAALNELGVSELVHMQDLQKEDLVEMGMKPLQANRCQRNLQACGIIIN